MVFYKHNLISAYRADLVISNISIMLHPPKILGVSISNIRHAYRSLTISSCQNLSDRILPKYILDSKLHKVVWPKDAKPRNIFITKKPWNSEVRSSMVDIINYMTEHHKHANIILNRDTIDELQHEVKNKGIVLNDDVKLFTGGLQDIRFKTDVLMTIGGDGTILRAVSQFSNFDVPPILSFSMGTLGFLLPFDINTYKEMIDRMFSNDVKVLQRSRLECHLVTANHENSQKMVHAMNEITLHRGSNPNLISLDIYVDNEFLTTTTADGIIISTPTGSTAYSLSSGGSIVHPTIKAILLTPICPRSLSFRPLILPSNSDIMVKLNQKSRNASVNLSIDGIELDDLRNGDEIHMRKQLDIDNHIWCMARSENDWTKDINELLGFNKSFKQTKK